MAVAFTVGVLAMAIRQAREGLPARPLDVLAIAASVLISIGMAIWSDRAGALQRTMFLVLYAWYASEAIRAYRFENLTTSRGPGRYRPVRLGASLDLPGIVSSVCRY